MLWENSTPLWKRKTSLILTVFAVIPSTTFPTLSYRPTFQNDGGHDKQNNSFTESFERLWKVVPAFREGHKLQESERILRIILVAWLQASAGK